MKKLLAAIFAGLFAISVTAPVVAQDKKQEKAAKKDGSGEGKKAQGEGKKADGKKKAEEKKK